MSKEFSNKILQIGLTYDDVLLVPAYSEVLPREVSIVTHFSKNITLNVPFVSSAMDTVTESRMAISMAREGGIGVIHKNMSIETQAEKVKQVKRSEAGMIIDPVTVKENATVGDAFQLMKDYKIGGIPVVDENKMLKGIVTNRDLRFEKEMSKKVTEIMTKDHLVTVKEEITLSDAEEILEQHKVEKLPVVTESGKLIGLITFRDIINLKENPRANKDEFGRLRVAAAVGVTNDTLIRVDALVKSGVDAVVIDTAHGHSLGVIRKLKEVKEKYANKIDVIVGNIATAEAALKLVENGADAVKVGIGPGSICTTRIVTGVGYPQLSAVMNVAQALSGTGVPVIADGGVRYTGDICKAMVAGADSVMMGSMLAGTKESPGETVIFEGRKFKSYRGMGSVEAMKKGSKDRYFQDVEDDIKKLVPEGIVGRVPYKGELTEVMHQFIGGLRAGMGYTGTKNIQELKKAKLVQITAAGMAESHPHSISVVKEAPNYSRR